MTRCGQPGCGGHLGKFRSCRDEALWQESLDGCREETGDVEFDGHFALLVYTDPREVDLDGTVTVLVPPGVYIVETASDGAVWVHEHESVDAARAVIRTHGDRYAAWLDA